LLAVTSRRLQWARYLDSIAETRNTFRMTIGNLHWKSELCLRAICYNRSWAFSVYHTALLANFTTSTVPPYTRMYASRFRCTPVDWVH
jgi:hypothetical protein